MHRNTLLNLLDDYKPLYDEEYIYKKQIYDFVSNHSDCFQRSCKIGHITASSFLLNYDLSKALLMHHKKLGIWLQLGGHCDGSSDVASVALKEAKEESGINEIELISNEIFDVDMHLVPACGGDHAHYHYDIRFISKVTSSNASVNMNDESLDLRWFSFETNNLPTQQRSIVRLFEKFTSMMVQS